MLNSPGPNANFWKGGSPQTTQVEVRECYNRRRGKDALAIQDRRSLLWPGLPTLPLCQSGGLYRLLGLSLRFSWWCFVFSPSGALWVRTCTITPCRTQCCMELLMPIKALRLWQPPFWGHCAGLYGKKSRAANGAPGLLLPFPELLLRSLFTQGCR